MESSAPSGAVATFQGLSSHLCLVATTLDSAGVGHFHHHRKLFGWHL